MTKFYKKIINKIKYLLRRQSIKILQLAIAKLKAKNEQYKNRLSIN